MSKLNVNTIDFTAPTREEGEEIQQALDQLRTSDGWAVYTRLLEAYVRDMEARFWEDDDLDKRTMRQYRTVLTEMVGLPDEFARRLGALVAENRPAESRLPLRAFFGHGLPVSSPTNG